MAFNSGLEYINHLKENAITDMKNIKCTHCNECCAIQTMLTDEEYTYYKNYFENDAEGKQILKRARNKVKRHLRKGVVYFMCPFTDDDTKKCQIYELRPQICQHFHCDKELYKVYETFKDENYLLSGNHSFIEFFGDIFLAIKN